ncbi:MAG: TRAM domain-containing protein [Candidatus Nanoarchaeia archaeon]
MFDSRQGGNQAPVQVGDELDVTIEAVGAKGDGIARTEGFVLFVPNTKENEQVHFRVTKVLRKVGFAEVVSGSPEETHEEAPEEAATEVHEAPAETEELPPVEDAPEAPAEEPAPAEEDIPPTPDEPQEKSEAELPPPPTEELPSEDELPPPPEEEKKE